MTSKAQGKLYVLVWSDDGEVKPVVDDDGRVPVDVETVDVTVDVNIESQDASLDVTETSPLTNIESRLQGYATDAWKKLQLLWGYTDRWSVQAIGTSTGGAATDAVIGPLDAGYVYVLESWMVEHNDPVARSGHLHVSGGSGAPYLWKNLTFTTGVPEFATCRITLKESDGLQLTVWGLADTKICVLTIWGHKMKVND